MPNQLTGPNAAPLVSARTVFVQATTGSDTAGDGSSGHPWQTLARAWADRLTYGELRAVYTIQLLGVGPYTMPVMAASICGDGGYFILQGDSGAESTVFSGTFTGDISAFAVGSSAGLGADTYKGDCLKVTSGLLSGARVMIASHTNTSITVAYKDVWTTLGATINGDTYVINRPGTVINFVDPVSGQAEAGCYDWVGMLSTYMPRHFICNVSFTKTSSGQFRVTHAQVALVGVKSVVNLQVTEKSFCAHGSLINGSILGVGSNTASNLLVAWGYSTTAIVNVAGGSTVSGVMYRLGSMVVGSTSYDSWIFWGGRCEGTTLLSGGWIESFGAGGYLDVRATVNLGRSSTIRINNFGATWKFTVTSGDCFRVKEGSNLCLEGTTVISGGTSAPAGFGVNCSGGGRCWFTSASPTLTGGTLNADLKTTNIVQPNGFLAATGDMISDLGGSESIVRIA
jgi:hypothetical protein